MFNKTELVQPRCCVCVEGSDNRNVNTNSSLIVYTAELEDDNDRVSKVPAGENSFGDCYDSVRFRRVFRSQVEH